MRFRRANLRTALVVICVLAVATASRGEWQNSLKPSGPAAGDVTLVQDGKAVRSIRIAANATTIEKHAAEELQHWIEQITGSQFEIVTTSGGPSVRIETDKSLGEEGYRIALAGDDLVLAGGTVAA